MEVSAPHEVGLQSVLKHLISIYLFIPLQGGSAGPHIHLFPLCTQLGLPNTTMRRAAEDRNVLSQAPADKGSGE